MPKAPGLLSTTNGCPVTFWNSSPTMRATMSVAPPGAYGTITLTARLGYLSCAVAAPALSKSAANTIVTRRFMRSSPGFVRAGNSWTLPLRDRSGRLDAVQAVRGVLDGEEHDVAVSRCLAGMHCIGGNVDDGAWCHVDYLPVDVGVKGSFQHINPLLVRMR